MSLAPTIANSDAWTMTITPACMFSSHELQIFRQKNDEKKNACYRKIAIFAIPLNKNRTYRKRNCVNDNTNDKELKLEEKQIDKLRCAY